MGLNLQNIVVFALHGFWGQGSDFDQFKKMLPANFDFRTVDLFLNIEFDLTSFETVIDQIYKSLVGVTEKKIFIGYSLGGRIGLHLMSKYPDLFHQWIFLSTHPGLQSIKEKNLRIQQDVLWFDKLNCLSWESFLSEWNAQPVFQGSMETSRPRNQFNKDQLSQAFLNLSLGKQTDMSDVIRINQKKIKWVVGYKDQKFIDLSENLKQKKILENYSRISSGHRILFDADLKKLMQIILQQQ